MALPGLFSLVIFKTTQADLQYALIKATRLGIIAGWACPGARSSQRRSSPSGDDRLDEEEGGERRRGGGSAGGGERERPDLEGEGHRKGAYSTGPK
eukprot:6281506-Pyramimonas_sp.AAC.1